jgi:amino acid transporter
MRFYSKKGMIMFPVLIIALIFMLLSTIIQFVEIEWLTRILGEPETTGSIADVIVPLAAAGLIIWLITTTYYEINGNTLKVAAGPIRHQIDINNIKSIRPSRNPLASPALSLDRLEVTYSKPTGKVDTIYSWKTVLISPKEKDLFIQELVKVNPNIEVKET